MGEWQPIETMPVTGCFLIAMGGDSYVVWWDNYFNGTNHEYRLVDDHGGAFRPDFWMPIPEIPSKSK